MSDPKQLSRRERQIMDVVYRLGEATAVQVREGLPDPPSGTAVRTLLRILESKGHLAHRSAGKEHVYRPTKPRGPAGRSALRGVLATFFEGSLERAVAAHLTDPRAELSDDEFARLTQLIEQAKQKRGEDQ
jgi:BlaI family penicillinase repressor